MRITGRYFVVGSARSGTTLLQAMLAAHPRIFSLPETHFFCESMAMGRRQRLGLVRKEPAQKSLNQICERVQRPDLQRFIPKLSPLFRSYSRAFKRLLDTATIDAGSDIWVEKTPHHIDYCEQIARSIKGARFIHIIRDGRDVLASQRKAMTQDPQYWAVERWPLSKMVDLWNLHMKQSLETVGDPAHLLVSYEDLILDSESALGRVCEFMGVDFESSMLRHWEAATVVAGPMKNDPWMANVFRPVVDTRLKNFNRAFSDREREYVEANLMYGGDVRGHTSATRTSVV